ncbi:MAG TPA: winged helix-turn-helix domain-containing protein [Chloroflexota bacterium]|nr:winged helix-turn-helix domain-containing protein [Chloroflexota bacterium]
MSDRIAERPILADADVAAAAALVADPARARMLLALSDGRALPAGELARLGKVAPSTASAHLAKLVRAGFLSVEQCRRHRYYRLASPELMRALEALAVIAPRAPVRSLNQADAATAICYLRTCYDHLAGTIGVQVTDAYVARGILGEVDDGFAVTPEGACWFERMGLDLTTAQRQRRLFAPACLDWSERRHHLAGALGAALTQRYLDLGWVARMPTSRALKVTVAGKEGLREQLGVDV